MHWKNETHYLIFYAKFESTPILKSVRVLVRICAHAQTHMSLHCSRPKIVIILFLFKRPFLSGFKAVRVLV